MKTSILIATLALAASMSATAETAGEPISPSRLPSAHTRQLVERFVSAYARQDATAFTRNVTKDFTARVYDTQAIDGVTTKADALMRGWRQQPHLIQVVYETSHPVATYATPDRRTLFVTYHVAGEIGQHAALVKVRGRLVSGIKDYPGSSKSTALGNANLEVASN
jgi:hypothetical protein